MNAVYKAAAMDITDEVWDAYIKTRDLAVRNRILTVYLYIVKVNAKRMNAACKSRDDLEEIINQGVLALIDCIEKFDPQRGVQFDSYASIRVRGAIIDYIRKQDWVPRDIRKKSIEISNAYAQLHNELNRPPEDEEVAAHLKISLAELEQVMAQAESFSLLSYEELIQENISFAGETASGIQTPEQELMRQELKSVLAGAIDKLSEKERLIVSLYYYDELKLKEIAVILGLTPARVSQMHSKALMKLKQLVGRYAVQ